MQKIACEKRKTGWNSKFETNLIFYPHISFRFANPIQSVSVNLLHKCDNQLFFRAWNAQNRNHENDSWCNRQKIILTHDFTHMKTKKSSNTKNECNWIKCVLFKLIIVVVFNWNSINLYCEARFIAAGGVEKAHDINLCLLFTREYVCECTSYAGKRTESYSATESTSDDWMQAYWVAFRAHLFCLTQHTSWFIALCARLWRTKLRLISNGNKYSHI